MHDVIVVGAGPAGNMAALRLASQGYKVAVIDWRQNIGDKLCTGIIGKECADRYPPEPSHIFVEANAGVIVSPSGKRYRVAKDDTQALIVNRVAYVNSFAEEATSAGADHHLGYRVTDIDVSEASKRCTWGPSPVRHP